MDKKPLIFIILSATLFGVGVPFSKILVNEISSVALAGFLYLGAFMGLTLYSSLEMMSKKVQNSAAKLEKKDIPWLAGGIIAGGIIAPISMLSGLTLVSGFSTSLLLNLEGLATALIAVIFFKENAGKRMWLALICMIISGVFLTWDTSEGKFTIIGPLLIIFAMVCWGIDNNLTRNISDKDPVQIVKIKGLIAGTTSISLALILGANITLSYAVLFAFLLGALSYGFSIVFFIKALKGLGAFRTGLFFSFAPFIGAIASLIMLREWIGWVMFPAMAFMIIGVWLISSEKHMHHHTHKPTSHNHSHIHTDEHHLHEHSESSPKPHAHEHTHSETIHIHEHYPDTHHRHEHKTDGEFSTGDDA